MCKHKLLHLALFTPLAVCIVPAELPAAFDTPEPHPVSFSLANHLSFRDFLIPNYRFDEGWYLSAGGARLYGMPEIQPYGIQLSAPGWKGRWRLTSSGLNVSSYAELCAGLGYERKITKTISAELELQLLNVSIEGYGSTWSYNFNARAWWEVQSGVEMAFTWLNTTNAKFGEGHYPLPRKYALAGKLCPIEDVQLLLELERDTRYPPTPRFGLSWKVYPSLTLLFGFQSDPALLSTGLSFLVKSYRATAAYQYHPDLGFSQCYGIVVTF